MKSKSLEIQISTLKCDNPHCDHEQTIRLENLGSYVGMLCPKCDHLLFSELDYEMSKDLLKFVALIDDVAVALEETLDPVELGAGLRGKFSLGVKDGEVNVGELEWETH